MHMLCLITYMIRSENGSSHAVSGSEKYEFAENLNWGAKLGGNHFFLNPLLRYLLWSRSFKSCIGSADFGTAPFAVQSCLLSISINYKWEVAFYQEPRWWAPGFTHYCSLFHLSINSLILSKKWPKLLDAIGSPECSRDEPKQNHIGKKG